MARVLAVTVAALTCAAAAQARPAPLPGVVSPSGNLSCFYVPVAHLLCDVKRGAYLTHLQNVCRARTGLDWHGFTLQATKPATFNCSGGILYNEGRDRPALATLSYGHTWRFGAFTCVSRTAGLTCASRFGHGLFLSRQSWRGW